jgi:ribA/ribD-fused uncharacterized protein
MFNNSGMGDFNDFGDDTMDMGGQADPMVANMSMNKPQRQQGGGQQGQQRRTFGQQQQQQQQPQRQQGGGANNMVMMMRNEIMNIKAAVIELQGDRDGLRNGIRKMKVENSRLKQRQRRLVDAVKKHMGAAATDLDDDDFMADEELDSLKEFYLIGGPYDPLGLRFDAKITDAAGKEHKSAERYFWYKMAETFGDNETAEKIRLAETTIAAEEKMKEIENFDEAVWNGLKLKFWEEATRLKVEQNPEIRNLLVATEEVYLAVASQDKVFGTGWRKNREEAQRPKMWDGENGGGKALMKLRESIKSTHKWENDTEKKAAESKAKELKATTWRRQRDSFGGRGRGNFNGRGGGRGIGRGIGGRGRGRGARASEF